MTGTSHSSPQMLTLHALRLMGWGDVGRVASRFALDRAEVAELLLDFQALGWVRHVDFAGAGGWTLTEAGRREDDRQLAAELAASGAAPAATRAHAAFLELNRRFLVAVTDWQVRPVPGDPMGANDHTDFRWDDRVLDELGALGRRLAPVCALLIGPLPRFDGYVDRYASALARVEAGQRSWVDGPGLDSCHAVWLELHEDLLATLGIQRGDES